MKILDLIQNYGTLAEWSKYKIVTVFPHANEEGKQPTECIRSDLNWLYRGKLYFVTIASIGTREEFIFTGVVLDITKT